MSESVGGSSKTEATSIGMTADNAVGEEGSAIAAVGELGLNENEARGFF